MHQVSWVMQSASPVAKHQASRQRLRLFYPILLSAAWLAAPVGARSASPATPASAEALYAEHCAGCHGRDGKAQTRLGRKSGAKDLTDKKALQRLSDADIAKVIHSGRKNARGEETMEPFGKVLSDKQIDTLVPFVRAFSK